jgi:hypothetical protein
MNLRCALAFFTLPLLSCATWKLAPLQPVARDTPVPFQQEQLAGAVREAIAESVGSLNLQELSAKLGRVQVSGVFPPDQGFLDFVAAVAEAQLVQRGVRIEPRLPLHVTATSALDFVLSITLDSSGVDVTMEKNGDVQADARVSLSAVIQPLNPSIKGQARGATGSKRVTYSSGNEGGPRRVLLLK